MPDSKGRLNCKYYEKGSKHLETGHKCERLFSLCEGEACTCSVFFMFLTYLDWGEILMLDWDYSENLTYKSITTACFFYCSRPPSQQKEPARVNGQEVRFFTPVRRSVRIERASLRYPVSLQEHDRCVSSYNDLISMEDKGRIEEELAGEISPSANSSPMYVYRENEALKDKVFVKLVCEEDAEV